MSQIAIPDTATANLIGLADQAFEARLFDTTGASPQAVARWQLEVERVVRQNDAKFAGLYREIEEVQPGDRQLNMTHLLLSAHEGGELAAQAFPTFPCLCRQILVPTPSAFYGFPGTLETKLGDTLKLSMELIDVAPSRVSDYQEVMRSACGPAAKMAIDAGWLSFFWALETQSALDLSKIEAPSWNQLHIFSIDPARFKAFLDHFASNLETLGYNFNALFGDLASYRTVRRWSFLEPVFESHGA